MKFPNLIASGTIRPARIVKMDGSTDNSAAEANANEAAVGVAGKDNKLFDNANHAEDGDPIRLQDNDGEIEVECGGSITNGGRFKSDADGKAVAIGTTGTVNQESLGYVLETGADTKIVRAIWAPLVVRPEPT